MQFIPIRRGLVATVSDEDYEYLRQFRWTFCNGYVRRWVGGGHIWLHHEVLMQMKVDVPVGCEVDHIDRFPLNNVRENLRVVTRSVNNYHRSYYLRTFDNYVSPA
jgi:hypothetical protein